MSSPSLEGIREQHPSVLKGVPKSLYRRPCTAYVAFKRDLNY